MRSAFSKLIVSAAKDNPQVLLLTGDHGYALFDQFRKSCPEKYINAGVAEQNMVGVAAGLSKMGFLPIVYGLSSFIPVRVLEQIKIDLCYDPRPCILIGDGAGVVYSHLGTSHQSTEDIAALRSIPNIAIFSPADGYELETCFRHALTLKRPAYIRIGKDELGKIHTGTIEKFKAAYEIKTGSSSALFLATGSMVIQAKKIAEEIYKDVSVWSVPGIKPLNSEDLPLSGKKLVVVFEEHSTCGGLGSAICELVSEKGDTRVLRIGVEDKFSSKCGTYDYLLREHGLDIESLKKKITEFEI
jgi:transketolase